MFGRIQLFLQITKQFIEFKKIISWYIDYGQGKSNFFESNQNSILRSNTLIVHYTLNLKTYVICKWFSFRGSVKILKATKMCVTVESKSTVQKTTTTHASTVYCTIHVSILSHHHHDIDLLFKGRYLIIGTHDKKDMLVYLRTHGNAFSVVRNEILYI